MKSNAGLDKKIISRGALNMHITIAYGCAKQPILLSCEVPADCTVQAAIDLSGICQRFPSIDLSTQCIGIFGQIAPLSHPLKPGDRIEIYTPLTMDPNQARLLRARRFN